ncbi:hypothetical protein MMC15_007470 [Xylographa vitiligo]|nr:hypothetical protein [Xylographa vitiligo]
MNDFKISSVRKPRLDLQIGEDTGGIVLIPGPVENMKCFYENPPATREDPLPLEKRPEGTIASLEADTLESNFDLPGLDQVHSMASSERTSNNSIVNNSGKQHASPNENTMQEITFATPEIIGGNGAKLSEIRDFRGLTTITNKVDEAVVANTLQRRSSTIESGRGFGLLKAVKEVDFKIDSTLDDMNGVEDIKGDLHLTQSPLFQTTSEMSAHYVVNPPSSDTDSSAVDSREPSNKDRHQPLLFFKTTDGTNATKNVLVQADKLKDDSHHESAVLADGLLVVAEEPKITENNLPLYAESGVPETTLATVRPEEINGMSAKSLDVDLKVTCVVEAEYELDSSPYESSSDSSSNASSDESSENDYEMLDPAEQARRLMQEDGGSEDEGGRKEAVNGPLRTLNEKPDEVVEKPNVAVTADMKIEELGNVEILVENLVLVKAKTTGEYQVLETGSVLCLQDRTVIGVVAEALGRVQQPRYSVRFTNANAIDQAGISIGTLIYYVTQYSTYVFTQTLKAFKGSDASNIHDEEVGADELEFSDDEVEAEYKRNLKLHRQARRGGRGSASNGSSRALQSSYPRKDGLETRNSEDISISYDDISMDDDLYTPLARPLNLHEQLRPEDISSSSQQGDCNRGNSWGQSRGDSSRSRGGRGGRSRGRGRVQYRTEGPNASNDRQQHAQPRLDLSLPPMPIATKPAFPMAPPQPSPSPYSAGSQYSPIHQHQHHIFDTGRSFGQHHVSPRDGQVSYSYTPQPPSPNYQPSYQHYSQHGQVSPQHYPSRLMNPYGQPLPLYANGPVSSSYSAPPLPPGAFVNPAFLGNNYQNPADPQPFAPSYEGYPSRQNGYLDSQR